MLATAILHACGSGLTSASTGGTAGSAAVPFGFGIGVMAAYGIAAAILTIGILTVVAIALQARRATPAAVAIPAGAALSPDGYYWWDGAAWRPVR